ncbi:alpha/beta hydrolase [Thalassotalea ponticola]|nr:alpha/beta hydrolase [Thalassotalea ponticola]
MTLDNTPEIESVRYPLSHLCLAGIAIGNKAGQPIICLHGWLDNAASFLPLFQQLAAKSSPLLEHYRFIAIDWPGHGLSDHRGIDAHYHFVDYVDDLYQLQQTLKSPSVNLLGHSMGGMVATLYASTFPDKVSQLILIEAFGLLTETDDPTGLLRRGIESRAKQGNLRKARHTSVNSAIKARVNVSDLDPASARFIVERGLVEDEGGYFWRSDARLRTVSLYRYALPQAQQIVKQIQAPITLIKGEQGFDMIDRAIELFAPSIDRLSIHRLTGGHHVHMQQPDGVVDIVEQTLTDTQPNP